MSSLLGLWVQLVQLFLWSDLKTSMDVLASYKKSLAI